MHPGRNSESISRAVPEAQGIAAFGVEVVSDLAEIDRISAEWEVLLDASPCNRAFSSPRWYTAWCRLDPGRLPYVIVARRGGRIAGVLPLVIDGRSATFQNMLTDYNDIVALDNDLSVATSLVQHAVQEPHGYDMITLPHLRADSTCMRAVRLIYPGAIVQRQFRETHVCYYTSLSGGYSDYLSSRRGRFRKRLKRLETIAARMNLVLCQLPAPGFTARRVVEDFLSLHLGRFGARSCFNGRAARSFVSEVIPVLIDRGSMRAVGLIDGNRLVGIDLYAIGKSSLCAWNGGFVPEIEECSPGKLLIGAGIRMAFECGLSEYDFLRGTEAYKESWANMSRNLGTLELATSIQ